MYLSEHNAGRIDYFRQTIEDWYTIGNLSEEEYAYLLACLVESVSFVSNTAGVYGAFLKKWDDRALKDIIFLDVSDGVVSNNPIIKTTGKIEDIIEDVPCDILYLDPPYTQNQYGTQYHLLETLVLMISQNLSAKLLVLGVHEKCVQTGPKFTKCIFYLTKYLPRPLLNIFSEL